MGLAHLIIGGLLIFLGLLMYNNEHFVGGSDPGWSNPSCKTKTCPDCPCPPDKPCQACSNVAGYNLYGPASITDVTVSYPCPQGHTTTGKDPNRCELSSKTEALAACSSDKNCAGILQPADGSSFMLVNVTPANQGQPTGLLYLEKI